MLRRTFLLAAGLVLAPVAAHAQPSAPTTTSTATTGTATTAATTTAAPHRAPGAHPRTGANTAASTATNTPANARPRPPPGPITPANPLEQAFVDAFTRESARPVFRRLLMTSQVAVAMASTSPESPPLFVDVSAAVTGGAPFHGGAIFTSADRLHAALGPNAPFAMMTGRDALERLRGRDVVLNVHLAPVLTLQADDVSRYLDQPDGR